VVGLQSFLVSFQDRAIGCAGAPARARADPTSAPARATRRGTECAVVMRLGGCSWQWRAKLLAEFIKAV